MSETSGHATDEEMRAYARFDAERVFGRPASEWDGMDFAFLSVSGPLALDEALNVATRLDHREGIGAIAISAHILGAACRRSDPQEAAKYAAVVNKITSGFGNS